MSVLQRENTKRIAKNTLLLYLRTLFSMFVSLYTSRVVLSTLGVEDYGVYNVVGGVVAMFSLISGSLSASVSRFLTFELGSGNVEKLKMVFSTSLFIHIGLALIILVLSESFGIWFLNTYINIPADRMYAANWVFQFSILSFMLSVISLPFNATIVAHERMNIFAFVGILDVLLRLVAILLLAHVFYWTDKLIIYSWMLVCIGGFLQCYYLYYCYRNFEECRFRKIYNKALLKEMTGFAGWNFIGSSSAILREQGGNIILNIFWGPSLNAARGIAVQVSSAVGSFVSSFMTAINPQITKSYASGDYSYMLSLIYRSSRFSYYVLLLLSLPILLNTHYVLMLWLNVVPEHVVLFVQLILVFTMCESVSNPLINAMLATGNIRNYQIIVGGLQMLNLPISYILLKSGFFPEIVLVVAIVISLCCLAVRLYLLRSMIMLSAKTYLLHVLTNIVGVTLISICFPVFLTFYYLEHTFIGFILSCLASVVCSALTVYYVGCSLEERTFIYKKIVTVKFKIWRR